MTKKDTLRLPLRFDDLLKVKPPAKAQKPKPQRKPTGRKRARKGR